MSHFLDRLSFFSRTDEPFAEGHGATTQESRAWEESYRQRWQHDKIVRSTHGVNCTGSCSWKIYVKGGIVTWETQQTDYPRTRPGMPNHEPRGCARGASYSWYLYSANRLKYPMVRSCLLSAWEEKRRTLSPVEAWQAIAEDHALMQNIRAHRGMGGFRRMEWNEVNELIAAANIYTAKTYGPDRIIGFSPIPAMSMVSYAAGSRYLSLIGGVCMSFYDWYCDLPPASPQTWGEQTDVPESADWFNSGYILMWGSNVPQTRTPDAHFLTEARYRGTKVVSIFPDFAEGAKLGDIWLKPKQGTDAALAMAMGHVILKKFIVDNPTPYFINYLKQYSDSAHLVRLEENEHGWVADRFLRASDLLHDANEHDHPDWKTLCINDDGQISVPNGSIGFRWEKKAKWNLALKASDGKPINPLLSLKNCADEVVALSLPFFGDGAHPFFNPQGDSAPKVLQRKIPCKRLSDKEGKTIRVVTVLDLILAQYGVEHGLGDQHCAQNFEDDQPYTPKWQEKITGVSAIEVIRVATEFADNAMKTQGKSMVIIGAAMNHWFHMDMNYRSIINLLVFCGCIGQSGGGWAHYVGQEKLRPQTGWTPLAFALDWHRPSRQMNSTSFFYAHTDQWRYESVSVKGLLSPTLSAKAQADFQGSLIDFNVRAERMGWLPSAPQLMANPLRLAEKAQAKGMDTVPFVVDSLKHGTLKFASADVDHPQNFPRNLFVWRSNLLGSSGKGHEYFMKHLLGTKHGVQGQDIGECGVGEKPQEVLWRDPAPMGKLDLLVTLDFRMSTTCLYSDIVLPTATWYEKNDLNTSDMHPFIHPLSSAVDPAWEAKSDWEIYKGIAQKFSQLCVGHLGVEHDVVTVPLLHDTPSELGQGLGVKDWMKGECEPIPNKTLPNIVVVERNYPETYGRYISLGPLMDKLGNGGKGIAWSTQTEVNNLAELNGIHEHDGVQGRPKIVSDIDAAETLLMLAPETNGEVAVKAWSALSAFTGIDHTHLAHPREHEKIRFRDVQAQPRKIISSPTWSGLESDQVSYNAGYTNVHELIPWRTLTGRQQLYQDHPWMLAFGEGLVGYKPPVDLHSHQALVGRRSNGHPEVVLNFITPHQKWGIHSTYTDNLLMLTLSRGGPIVWLSEVDAQQVGIVDNDWIEAFNQNGALNARAVVSQRVPQGMVMMYHAQEKIINVPGSELTGTRGGIHNSVTRAIIKPTHMIGGYAQQSYGFNYYGTVGSNRDEFVIVRKMNKVDWLDS